MWLFEKRGFTSTVAYSPTKDVKNSPHRAIAEASADPKGWLLVRARVRADLETMETVIATATGNASYSLHLDEDKGADYSFRGLVSREDMKAYLGAAVDGIDYDSHFKEVAERHSTQGAARHSAMMTVWSAMARLQPTSPYTGGSWYTDTHKKGSHKGGSAKWPVSGGTGTFVNGKWTPARPPAYVPPKTVVTTTLMREELKARPAAEIADDLVNGATDAALELWLAAKLEHPEAKALTDEQIDALIEDLVNDMPEDDLSADDAIDPALFEDETDADYCEVCSENCVNPAGYQPSDGTPWYRNPQGPRTTAHCASCLLLCCAGCRTSEGGAVTCTECAAGLTKAN